MNKTVLAYFAVLCLLSTVFPIGLALNIKRVKAEPKTIYVDEDNIAGPWDGTSDHPYQNITSGLEHALAEDTIFVYDGMYYENIIIDRSVFLVGENRDNTIINGLGWRAINIIADKVSINGFTVRNTGPETEGIRALSSNNNITDNIITNNRIGIYLDSSDDNNITDNVITDNDKQGIWSFYSDDNVIEENTISNNGWEGIGLERSDYTIISNNIISNNGYGIGIKASSSNTLSGNVVSNSTHDGVSLLRCSDLTLKDNNVSGNRLNFRLTGTALSDFIHDIDTSNEVDGKPIYYWVTKHDMQVPLDAGYVAVINSTNITVKNLNLTKNYHGVLLFHTTNSTIQYVNASDNWCGIWLDDSNYNTISRNIVTRTRMHDSDRGINLGGANNTISENTISNYAVGINLGADNNTIVGNTILTNDIGISAYSSYNNTVYHNNFIDNTNQVYSSASINIWDDGYPSGGNYWNDYNRTDFYSGSYQNETGSDGIGDEAYVIEGDNQDGYPLMGMFGDFNATLEYHVTAVCNSTISAFCFNGTAISFNVTGEDETAGFCRICIPTALLNDTYKVFVNGTEVSYTLLPCSNSTHSYLYFTYNHSTKEVVIIPEFPTWISMLLTLIVFTASIVIYKRRLIKTPIH